MFASACLGYSSLLYCICAGVIYPEFRNRTPPPSYSASVVDYQYIHAGTRPVEVIPNTPPPAYRSQPGTLRILDIVPPVYCTRGVRTRRLELEPACSSTDITIDTLCGGIDSGRGLVSLGKALNGIGDVHDTESHLAWVHIPVVLDGHVSLSRRSSEFSAPDLNASLSVNEVQSYGETEHVDEQPLAAVHASTSSVICNVERHDLSSHQNGFVG